MRNFVVILSFCSWFLVIYLCACMACVCTRMHACMRVCVNMCGSQKLCGYIGYLHVEFSILVFEAGVLIKPGDHWLVRLTGQWAPGLSIPELLSTGITNSCQYNQFSCGCWGSVLKFSWLPRQGIYWISYLPSSWTLALFQTQFCYVALAGLRLTEYTRLTSNL